MKSNKAIPETIDDYMAGFPKKVRKLLQQVRKTIKQAAPEAEEKISYQIPTFALNGNLIHFAAWKNHIGLYPGAAGLVKFKRELAGYESAKGSVQFPFDKSIPFDLITRIVKFRVAENLKKAKWKQK